MISYNITVVSLPELIEERAYRHDLSIDTGCCYIYVWLNHFVLSSALSCGELIQENITLCLQGPVCLQGSYTSRTLWGIRRGEVGDSIVLTLSKSDLTLNWVVRSETIQSWSIRSRQGRFDILEIGYRRSENIRRSMHYENFFLRGRNVDLGLL